MTKAIKDGVVISNSIQDFRSGVFKVVFFKTLKQLKKFFKKLRPYQFIIYGVPSNNMLEGTIGLKSGNCDIANTTTHELIEIVGASRLYYYFLDNGELKRIHEDELTKEYVFTKIQG